MTYAELQVTTHFSFLRGASSPREMFEQAKLLGLPALGIVDRNSLAGIVRAYEASKETGVRLVVGCRLDLDDGASLLVYPTDRAAYSRLCRLLSVGKSRAGKGKCSLAWEDVEAWNEGLLAVLLGDHADEALQIDLRRLKRIFKDRAYMALIRRFAPNEHLRLWQIEQAAQAARVPTIAMGDVLYHHPSRRMLQDVVSCIRQGCTIDDAGFRLERHADRFLKDPAEMARLFERHPEALARTNEIVRRCRFSLDELCYQYPSETEPGETAQQKLERLTWEGAERRYGKDLPEQTISQLKHELTLIRNLNYAPYFLTVHSIVNFAREPRHSLPGARLGSQFRRLLRARHHLHRPYPFRTSLRALHLPGAQRAARYRCRLRARAARGGHPVDLRHLWPHTGRAHCGRDLLPHPRCGARSRQGVGSAGGCDERSVRTRAGLEHGGCQRQAISRT